MNTFAVLFLCMQACLVQNVFSQCRGKYGLIAAIAPGYAPTALGPAAFGPYGYPGMPDYGYSYPGPCGSDSYGGAGEGHVAVAGELPVAGTSAVAGQVPIMGAVQFAGPVPAVGVVTITGTCACECGAPYLY